MQKKTATRRKQTASHQGPSLEQQLKGSGVIAGSALEQSIECDDGRVSRGGRR